MKLKLRLTLISENGIKTSSVSAAVKDLPKMLLEEGTIVDTIALLEALPTCDITKITRMGKGKFVIATEQEGLLIIELALSDESGVSE